MNFFLPEDALYTMFNFVAAMSSASTSAVSRAYAFFFPSGLIERTLISPNRSYYRYQTLESSQRVTDAMNVPHKRVDLDRLDIIKRLQRCLDLPFICLDIHNENQRIILLDLLHRTFRVEGMNEHFVVVQTGLMGDRFPGVFWVAGCAESLGSVECGRKSDLAVFL